MRRQKAWRSLPQLEGEAKAAKLSELTRRQQPDNGRRQGNSDPGSLDLEAAVYLGIDENKHPED